jgi:hypothetical protein
VTSFLTDRIFSPPLSLVLSLSLSLSLSCSLSLFLPPLSLPSPLACSVCEAIGLYADKYIVIVDDSDNRSNRVDERPGKEINKHDSAMKRR